MEEIFQLIKNSITFKEEETEDIITKNIYIFNRKTSDIILKIIIDHLIYYEEELEEEELKKKNNEIVNKIVNEIIILSQNLKTL